MARQRGKLRHRRRLRRSPEQARVELLDGAERVFAQFHPDEVGLKDIAREVGVSHALVTHYFGTYAGLVAATLERRVRALRERVLVKLRETGAVSRPAELLGLLFDALADPVHVKLVKWLVASEPAGVFQTFALQDQGLHQIVVEAAHAITPEPTPHMIETLELAIVTAVSAAYGYALNKHALAGALGRALTPDLDDAVRRTLAEMLQGYLMAKLGAKIPP
jgi:TetR/AcrR family transcriptional regulator, repressor for neighboring sulfatase